MTIEIKSYNQLLGAMIRKILAETALNDINDGSALLSLLEAAATNDYENNTAILNVLELLNINAIKNNDLDARAADYGLARLAAVRASGLINIYNTNITKRSTGLYVIKPAPIAGQTTLYVNNTSGWSSTGDIYIGRGTNSFEGPLAYTSITVYPTYSAITLASALQKDHLISEVVVDSQGQTDLIISAGTVVKIPANNQNPEILYTTLRDAVIPAGEDVITNVEIVAQVPGSIGNAPINTITIFDPPPFSGASVANTSALSNGDDIETDNELRNRIKSYSVTLARGTAPSILSSVIGVSDPDDSKQVASAVLTEPVAIGDPSILYIDDGSGFQPSYQGQSVDKLLSNANGSEGFLQLANYPLPRPQVVNTTEGPFTIKTGSLLRVEIDGIEETVEFNDSDFLNPSAATITEIIIAINSKSTLFKARFADNSAHILIYPVAHDVETIKVSSQRSTDNPTTYVNSLLKFPTNEFSYISLYQNSTRLREKEKNAEIETIPFALWNITATGNIIIAVDGTPSQDRNFALSDFAGATSFNSLTLPEWVAAFNAKFAGLTAEATPSETMTIKSNKIGALSSIQITGGTYIDKWFSSSSLTSQGQSAQFELNRQNGNIRILTNVAPGDSISAGVEDAKGFVISSATSSGIYNLSSDSFGRPAEMVVVVDSNTCIQRSVQLSIGSTITISSSGSVMRIMSSAIDTFSSLLPGDYIYIASKTSGWVQPANSGLFKIIKKGNHITAGSDSFIEVYNVGVVVESSPLTVSDSLDIKAFSTDGYPQVWRGSYLSNPAAASISEISSSLGKDLIGVNSSIFRSNSIKITSTSESNGSIAVPVSIGSASLLFAETESEQEGNPPHIANAVSSKALISMFKRTEPTDTNVWLDRHTYSDVRGALTADSIPDLQPFSGTYSEILQSTDSLAAANVDYNDYISMSRGNNRGQFRAIKSKIAGDQVGTQQGTARTALDHVTGDEFQLIKAAQISSEDSMVVVMDKDATNKTIDIKMSRTGVVNSGSVSSFLPTTTEFSANDYDNESGVTFSNTTIWGKSINGTDFSDYALWMQARNWYSSGGLAGANGKLLLRAAQFGPNGEKLRFNIEYPSAPDQANSTFYTNTPSHTTFSYIYGSGGARATAISSGDTVAVKGPYPNDSTNFPNGITSTGNYFDYTFSAGNFASVTVGDVVAINDGSGIGTYNRGQFRVANKTGLTIRVFNPDATATSPGSAEVTTINTIADVVGTPTQYTIDTVADIAGSLDLKYFKIYDSAGSVAVWIDVDNSGSPPPPHGAARGIKVASIVSGDSAAVVASKIGTALAVDNAYTVGVIGNQLVITSTQNGVLSNATAETSGFSVSTLVGTSDTTLDGKYFLIYDDEGSVAVWFDINNNGTQEPFHGANRSIQVSTVSSGASANTVASAVAAALNSDVKFIAIASSNTVTTTRSFNGNVPASSAATSGFSLSDASGTLPTSELITNQAAISVFPLTGTTTIDIQNKINESDIIKAVKVSGASIVKSTKEDDYLYSGNSTALAYGHNPNSSDLRNFISLYDGVNYVKAFSNSNPNFTMKQVFTLQGVAPSIYSMNTCPNPDTSDVGEQFKLIPTTVNNIHHHLSQKALSQLPIVAKVAISTDRKNIQISSKNLGSSGAVEIVGGSANKAQAYLVSESEVSTDASGKYLLVKIPAFPDTFNTGDLIKLENDSGTKRNSRLISTDSMSVTSISGGKANYSYNPKAISLGALNQITITDVSSSYGRPAGIVWRWTHDGLYGATFAQVREGDLLIANGALSGWKQGNKIGLVGDGLVNGFPVIAVNDSLRYVDVVNPFGAAMSATAIGVSSTVQICPTPIIKWKLKHAARVPVNSISRVGSTITVACASSHLMNTGDSVDLIDSDILTDGTYGPITSIDSSSFSFTMAGSDFTELSVGASIIKTGKVVTRYRLENLGTNSVVRISLQDGESPRFADCGVAVDDYIVIGGNTFKANNNGRFRVLAVDNSSILLLNAQATDELNTVRSLNNKSLQANWTANTSTVTGIAGTFKNIQLGDWIKKAEDSEIKYRQVINMYPSTSSLTTTVTLGSNYDGVTAISPGVYYDQMLDYDAGVELKSTDDIAIYEGDSVVIGDVLSVQNIVDSSWFNINNTGSFDISEIGIDSSTYKPFVRVQNTKAISESNRLLSVNTEGFYIVESATNKYYSIRQIHHTTLDDIDATRRSIYVDPHNRSYKFSSANATSITHMGKFGYSTDTTTGVDGYLYYTGLLRRVQRIVDGYEPDIENFPGRRSIGSLIETLPPLNRRIEIIINITTDEGVNLSDITDNIKSVIINYVNNLGVGDDVVLSEIIAAVMGIRGVGAITFTSPVPSTERITIAKNEKATISPNDIGMS
jgi:uncharacterized phage protein gp47/JayE